MAFSQKKMLKRIPCRSCSNPKLMDADFLNRNVGFVYLDTSDYVLSP